MRIIDFEKAIIKYQLTSYDGVNLKDAEGNNIPIGGAGADGNTVLYGAGAPDNGLGVNGNFYINTTNHFIYGPKAGGVWPTGTSLVGPPGATGAAGAAGAQGDAGINGRTILYGTAVPTTEGSNEDFYIRTSTNFIYGPKAGGVWPAGASLVGPAGSAGAAGATGAQGNRGGFNYLYDSTVTEANPTSTKFRFNSVTFSPGVITAMYVSDEMVGTINIGATITTWKAGDRLTILPNANAGTHLAIADIVSVTDMGGWKKLALSFISGIAFTNGEACAIQHSPIATAANMAAGTFKGNITGSSAAPADVAFKDMPIGSRYRPAMAIIPQLFNSFTGDTDPTATKFKLNNATLASVTKMFINAVDANSTDTTFDILRIKANDKLVIMNAAQDSVFTTLTATGAAVVKTGYYEIPGTCSAGTLPANNETCTLVYVAVASMRAILAAGNFARFVDDGSGGYDLADQNDTIVNGVVTTYALASHPVSGVPTLPAANTFETGTEVRIHQDCFTGTGKNALGAFCKADAANNKWIPSNNAQRLFANMGTTAAPLASLSAPGRFDIPDDPQIPAGLINGLGGQLRLVMQYRKIGTSATLAQGQIRLGTDLVEANYANNAIAYQLSSISATTNFDLNSDTLVTFQDSTHATTNRNTTRGGGGTASLWSAITTNLDTTDDMAISFAMSILTSPDTADLIGYEIWWVN